MHMGGKAPSFTLHSQHVCSRAFGSKSDPFIHVSRRTETAAGTTWLPVLQSPIIKNTSAPKWLAMQLPLARVCLGDLSSKLLIEVRCSATSHQRQAQGAYGTARLMSN
jgi:hypothetical protein